MSERLPRAIVLKGGTVIDGTGVSRFVADVRIEGERIAAVGARLGMQDADVLDVAGKIVAPGFIDVHTHDDQMVLAGAAADIDALTLLARISGDAGGVYTTHIRDEFDKVIESLDEAFATGRRGGVPVVVSHHKCAGPQNWGRTVQTLAHIDAARTQQPIALDMYPYIAGSTVLRKEMVDGIIDILVTWSTPHPETTGRMLEDIAAEWGCARQET